ncbi:hypothetical protein DL93DRAFT_1358685 [Clavulina sp. PMI_390]|nr:hypothetical protein DL93DRAFT_1358685 [Clavulina sp. PMI_390]
MSEMAETKTHTHISAYAEGGSTTSDRRARTRSKQNASIAIRTANNGSGVGGPVGECGGEGWSPWTLGSRCRPAFPCRIVRPLSMVSWIGECSGGWGWSWGWAGCSSGAARVMETSSIGFFASMVRAPVRRGGGGGRRRGGEGCRCFLGRGGEGQENWRVRMGTQSRDSVLGLFDSVLSRSHSYIRGAMWSTKKKS